MMNDRALKEQYDEMWRTKWTDMQTHGPVHRHQRRIYRALLNSVRHVRIDSVLDVGAGAGENLLFIRSLFPSIRVCGMDISDVPLQAARWAIPDGCFWTGDIQSPQDAVGRCDLVTLFEVIEHLEQDRKALKNIHAITNKYLLLSTVCGAMRPVECDIGHLRNYHPAQLTNLLDDVGFRVLRIVQWGFPFYSPLFRTLSMNPTITKFSYGRYGLRQRLACHVLYGLYFMNSWNRGDKLIVLAEKTAPPHPDSDTIPSSHDISVKAHPL